MTQATIMITGIGPVSISTSLSEVFLVGALTVKGEPVNCSRKKVRRNKKAAALAAEVEGIWLTEVKPGYFRLLFDTDLYGEGL